jgi:hypothetical protein
MVDGVGYLYDQLDGVPRRHGLVASRQPVGQIRSSAILRGDVDPTVGFACLMHWHDIRVTQPGGRAAFTEKSVTNLFAFKQLAARQFDGHPTFQNRIGGHVDDPKTTSSNPFVQPEPSNLSSGYRPRDSILIVALMGPGL